MASRMTDAPGTVTIDGKPETPWHTLTIPPSTLDIAPRDGKVTVIAGQGAATTVSLQPSGPNPRRKPTKAEKQAKKKARKRAKAAKRRSKR